MIQSEIPNSSSLASIWLDDRAWLESLPDEHTRYLYAIVVDIRDLLSLDVHVPLAALLDATERDRAASFRYAEDRNRFIISHAIFRAIAGRALGTDPAALSFLGGLRQGQAPRVATASGPALSLSLSHAGAYVAVVVGRTHPVGIDVEWHRPIEDLDRLVGATLTAKEADDLATRPASSRHGLFLRWWTAKEAALKAHGSGLAIKPDNVSLSYDRAGTPEAAFVADGVSSRRYAIWSFDPFGPSSAVVAVAATGYGELRVTYSRETQLLDLSTAVGF